MSESGNVYPVDLNVDYPEKSDRLSVFFRIILVIPILIVLSLLLGERETQEMAQRQEEITRSIGFVVGALVLLILFRGKYPRWWFDWNKQLMAFSLRVFSYLFLLRDEYPSTDEEQAVHLVNTLERDREEPASA